MADQHNNNGISDEQARFNRITARASYLSAIAALTGVVVGSVGVYLGWQSFEFTKKIETLRLKPHLMLVDIKDGSKDVFLSLRNNGPGAAIIKNIKFSNSYLDESVDLLDGDGPDFAKKAVRVMLTPTVEKMDEAMPNIAVASYSSNTVLPAGETMNLLRFEDSSKATQDMVDTIRAVWMDPGYLGVSYSLAFCSLDELYCDELVPASEK